MSVEANKERLRAVIEQVWNEGHPERLPEFYGDAIRGEVERLHTMLTQAFPDLQMRIEDVVAEGDRVVVRLTVTGTHRGLFRGVPATGRAVSFGAIRIYQLTDGKVVNMWAQQDALGLLTQIRD
jgi:steroid delta-isomerase-like uncharacterized protein